MHNDAVVHVKHAQLPKGAWLVDLAGWHLGRLFGYFCCPIETGSTSREGETNNVWDHLRFELIRLEARIGTLLDPFSCLAAGT